MFKSSSLCFNSSNLGTFWLKIEQFWPFEEISILVDTTALTDTDHLRIKTKFVTSGFHDFLLIYDLHNVKIGKSSSVFPKGKKNLINFRVQISPRVKTHKLFWKKKWGRRFDITM